MDKIEELLKRLVQFHGVEADDEAVREYAKAIRKRVAEEVCTKVLLQYGSNKIVQ